MNRCVGLLLCLAALAGCASNDDDPNDDDINDTDTTDTDTTDTDTPEDTDTTPPLHTPAWYTDDDGDGYSEDEGDCDDTTEFVSPGLSEICDNGVDDDCDTVIDDVAAGSSTEGPLPYLQASDSPWDTIGLSTFVIEDFEDQLFPKGVTVSAFTWSSAFGGVQDSVDGDDGDPTNGACAGCEALWNSSSITFTFDPVVLGTLPTYAGIVVTDSGAADATVDLSAMSACESLGALTTTITFGDGSIAGDTAEDRFVGFISPAGMTTLTIDLGVPMEVDHLQFGW